MYRFALYLSILIASIADKHANALFLTSNSQNPILPFDVTYQQNGNLSFDLIFQIINQSPNASSVLSWQAALKLHPVTGTQGNLAFQAVGTPTDSLFGPNPGPLSDLVAPSNQVLAFDADTLQFVGAVVSEHEARNILQLTFSASADAVGGFEVITPKFNPQAPDLGSSWFASDGIEPQPFENSAPSSVPGFVLLGTINIVRLAQPGDYNLDQVVDELDIHRWREDFGMLVDPPGQGADGNRNGTVDAADYVVWRDHVSTASAAVLTRSSSVPEPGTLTIFVLANMLVSLTLRCRRQCN